MDQEVKQAKNKLKQITYVRDFENLLEQTMLSDEEKEILRLIYEKQKSLSYIADTLGLSESSVKKKHRKSLLKIARQF